MIPSSWKKEKKLIKMKSKTIIFTLSNFCQTGIFQSWCPWGTGRHARWKVGEDHLDVPSLLQRLLNAQGVPQNVWSEVRASPIVVLILSCHPLAKANRKKRWWSNILLLPAELESPSSSVTWESICSWETGLGGDSTQRYKKTHSLKKKYPSLHFHNVLCYNQSNKVWFPVKPEFFQVLFHNPLRLFILLRRSCSLSYPILFGIKFETSLIKLPCLK